MSVFVPLILAIVIVVVVLLMLRKGKLREKYALLWLIIGLLTIVLGVFPGLLSLVSSLLGVQVPANLLFALSILLLLGVSLQYSRELTVLEEETRTLAEEVAILRLDLQTLSDRIHSERSQENKTSTSTTTTEEKPSDD